METLYCPNRKSDYKGKTEVDDDVVGGGKLNSTTDYQVASEHKCDYEKAEYGKTARSVWTSGQKKALR